MVGCVQIVAENKKSIVQFEVGQKKEISSSLLLFLSSNRRFVWMRQYHVLLINNKD